MDNEISKLQDRLKTEESRSKDLYNKYTKLRREVKELEHQFFSMSTEVSDYVSMVRDFQSRVLELEIENLANKPIEAPPPEKKNEFLEDDGVPLEDFELDPPLEDDELDPPLVPAQPPPFSIWRFIKREVMEYLPVLVAVAIGVAALALNGWVTGKFVAHELKAQTTCEAVGSSGGSQTDSSRAGN